MKAMIFAAGLGTRLKPITDTLPKALVPVCERPLIEYVCRKLRAAGIEEAVVNVHHFADKIENWISGQDILSLYVSDERNQLLETGGAVLHARRYLEGCGRFLIHNVDIFSNADINWLESQVRDDALATLMVSKRPTTRFLLFHPQTMRLVGWTNVRTGEVKSPYEDLNPEGCVKMAFSGIHILSDNVFSAMEQYADNPRFPIIDFYLWACAEYKIYGVPAKGLHIIDVGKLDSLQQAEKLSQTLL
jgi:NDP-sugar pyrophosphorylase family protein